MSALETYLAGSPLLALGAAYAAGVLAGLSPCIYLMIPVVSAYVGAKSVREAAPCPHCLVASGIAGAAAPPAGRNSRARALSLSLAFVVGMATVYSLLGMIAALTGSMFGSISTSPWALLFVANVLLLLALNILGAIPFPAWLRGPALKPAAGGVAGAFLVGAASGLVASPCTSPVLFALLTYVATTQRVLYGGTLLFVFSLGMGSLLILAGTFSGLAAALPRSPRWMAGVKTAIGLLVLGLAEYYLLKAGQAWF